MKRVSVLVVAAVVALAFAGLALGATKTLQGSIAGSQGGKVTIQEKLSTSNLNGKKVQVPHSLAGIAVKNVPYGCEDGSSGSLSYKFGKVTIGDSLSFHTDAQATSSMQIEVTGKLSSQFGKKITGTASVVGSKKLPEGSTTLCGTFLLSGNAGGYTAK